MGGWVEGSPLSGKWWNTSQKMQICAEMSRNDFGVHTGWCSCCGQFSVVPGGVKSDSADCK